MRIKLADDLKLRPMEWWILRYLLSQFHNGHLFEIFYKRISLCLLNEKYVNWRTWWTLYPPLENVIIQVRTTMQWQGVLFIRFISLWIILKIFIRVFSPFFSPTLSDMSFTSEVSSELYSLIFLLSSFLALALEVLLGFTLIVVAPALPSF